MANNKYYYQAEIHFGDESAMYHSRHKNFIDCIKDLNYFAEHFGFNNDITKVGIFKYKVDGDIEVTE